MSPIHCAFTWQVAAHAVALLCTVGNVVLEQKCARYLAGRSLDTPCLGYIQMTISLQATHLRLDVLKLKIKTNVWLDL